MSWIQAVENHGFSTNFYLLAGFLKNLLLEFSGEIVINIISIQVTCRNDLDDSCDSPVCRVNQVNIDRHSQLVVVVDGMCAADCTSI